MDRVRLAEYLRTRREARQPEDVGLPRGRRRRTGRYCGPVRLLHPEVGPLDLHCQRLIDPDQAQQLVVYTAAPGSESQEKLRLLSVIGGRHVDEVSPKGSR